MFNDFADFVKNSPSQFHSCSYIRKLLIHNGFQELKESAEWEKIPKKGFFIRDERSVFAWNDNGRKHFVIAGGHLDIPCLLLKPNYDEIVSGLRRLRVANYGNFNFYSWFDRNLKIAGRVICKTANGIEQILFDSEEPIAIIPSNNNGNEFGKDLEYDDIENYFNPIYGTEKGPSLKCYVANKLNINEDDILSWNLRLLDTEEPDLINGLVTSQGINGLSCCYAALKSFLDCNPENGTFAILSLFDNKEIGSSTRTSAGSNLINYGLKRIIKNDDIIRLMKAKSMYINTDTIFATHPSWISYLDTNNPVIIGKGPGIEINHSNRKSSDILGLNFIRRVASANNFKLQIYSELNFYTLCTTIGPTVETGTSIRSVDIGIPVYSKKSIRESCSLNDIIELYSILKEIFNKYSSYA